MRETHDRKRHETKFTGEYVYQERWARTKMVDRDDHSCDGPVSYVDSMTGECRRHIDHLRSRRAGSYSMTPVSERTSGHGH